MSNGGPQADVHQEQKQGMANGHGMQRELDLSKPNAARIFDYFLGGKDNYAADREAARRLLRTAPDVPLATLENREFLKRAVAFIITATGIRQFVDIGPGLPTQANVHQLAKQHDPQARVAYIDNDPVVLAQGKSLLRCVPGVIIIDGDLRDPERLLSDPALRGLIDFAEPVALCLSLVLQLIPASDEPHGIVARLRDELCPGSYLVLSHLTGAQDDAGTLAQITGDCGDATTPLAVRSRAEVTQFFAGFRLVGPGVVFLSQWQPASCRAQGGTRRAYAGVGRRAGSE
jgi:hypothetical protein